MNCLIPIKHIVNHGDTLPLIARVYHTTVNQILSDNPSVAPGNLRVGTILRICPGITYWLSLNNLWWLNNPKPTPPIFLPEPHPSRPPRPTPPIIRPTPPIPTPPIEPPRPPRPTPPTIVIPNPPRYPIMPFTD